MDYNKFNIEEKYDSYKNIKNEEAEKIIFKLSQNETMELDYDSIILKSKMYLKLDKFKEAIECLKKSLSFKQSEEAYDLLSLAYYEISEYKEALNYVNLSFKISEDEFLYNHKAKILEKLKDYEEAFNSYYEGLKFLIHNNKSYGDLEIFGENLERTGNLLKEKLQKRIIRFITEKNCEELYNCYSRLLDIIIKEEENDQYHSFNTANNINYLHLIEIGRQVLLDCGYFLELLNIYKTLYKVECNLEYEDLTYVNKDYIDRKIKELIVETENRTSLQNKEGVYLKVLEEAIAIGNKDFHEYLYEKGAILFKTLKYNGGLEVLRKVIDDSNAKTSIKIKAYQCIIIGLENIGIKGLETYEAYKIEFSNFLKTKVEEVLRDETLTLDEKCNIVLEQCDRALNMNLDNNYWPLKTEEVCLFFGEEYEETPTNQSNFKIIESYNKAIKIYDKLIQFNEYCAHGYYRKGRAIVLVLRILNSSETTTKDSRMVHDLHCYSYSEVIFNLNKAISLNHTNSKYFNLLSRTHFEIGEYDKALTYIDKALTMDEGELYISLNKVFVLIRSHKYTEAIDALLRLSFKNTSIGKVKKTFLPKKDILNFLMGIFNIYPRQDKIYYLMAYYFYYLSDFNYKKALIFINNAIELGDDERFFLLKAKIYMKNGQYKEAIRACEDAITIDDHYDEAYALKEQCSNMIDG
ncbi:tetratricopeptide (TPR) repeat protein [Clostridium punense]|uniref:Tetratricopeptide (TPR) repeat protein n=1 Tax=Clostridium punense TaxID=1054297 RepID=A0ABS4JYZ8_9CLOT|nr:MULTISPECIES: tetratricopeptide repeat protein [Clostridium]EQB87522.1 hypothetical protein M918_09015 [Clostridium sp. BL8]MBP2020765.1 tetratricopeptide (TPR) repeat protein [Clostridium punense]